MPAKIAVTKLAIRRSARPAVLALIGAMLASLAATPPLAVAAPSGEALRSTGRQDPHPDRRRRPSHLRGGPFRRGLLLGLERRRRPRRGHYGQLKRPLPVVYPPAGITVTPAQTSAQVSWAATASVADGTLAGYTATAAPGGESCTTTTTTCTITGLAGLAGGLTYTITVITHSTAGDSGPSMPPTTVPASDGPIISGYHETACIDDPGYCNMNGTNVVMWQCDGTNEQNWTVKKDGTIRINGKCLDVLLGGKASKTPVDLATCTGNSEEQWQALNGTLVNPRSAKCLDDPRFNTANGTPLETYTCNGGANQQWQIP
jgi:hypothetical protein